MGQDKFEIEGYDESPLPQEIIDTKATHLFKGWRYHMHEHYKELVKEGTDPYSKPFVGVSEEDWRYMIDEVFLGDTHKVINLTVMDVSFNCTTMNNSKVPSFFEIQIIYNYI